MKTYKGVVLLKCDKKTCEKVDGKIVAECVNCPDCQLEIVDLENKPIAKKDKKNGR